jgi:hypothetical protein
MEHLADELNRRWLIWVLFLEMHNESEGSILKGRVGWSDNDSVPEEGTSTSLLHGLAVFGSKTLLTKS